MADVVVSTDQLCKRFAGSGEVVEVIDNLSFDVCVAESMAVTGRSGSGKSTLLNLLCGLESADAGTVTVAGQSFSPSLPPRRLSDQWAALRKRTIGVVFQEANLMPALTLLENVCLRARLAGQPAGDERYWLEQLGVGAEAGRFPDQVSGGQRQRAALAMVFAMQPAIILADEPTGSLDRHTAEEVTNRLFEVQQNTRCALVLATHDLTLAGRCHQRLNLGSAG